MKDFIKNIPAAINKGASSVKSKSSTVGKIGITVFGLAYTVNTIATIVVFATKAKK